MSWRNLFRPVIPPIALTTIRYLPEFRNPGGLLAYARARRRCAQDRYVPWLCRLVGGWLEPDDGNIVAMDHAIKNLPQGSAVLEIGSFLGLSTNVISYLLHKYQTAGAFFSTDPWIFEGTEERIGGHFDAASAEYREYAKTSFLRNGTMFGGEQRSHAFELESDVFFEYWNQQRTETDLYGREVHLGGSLGFAYIDGNHTYEQCLKDFENVDRCLLAKGFILFDDSGDRGTHRGCNQAVREVLSKGGYRLIFRQPNYLIQKLS
jgi:hypothetical protein